MQILFFVCCCYWSIQPNANNKNQWYTQNYKWPIWFFFSCVTCEKINFDVKTKLWIKTHRENRTKSKSCTQVDSIFHVPIEYSRNQLSCHFQLLLETKHWFRCSQSLIDSTSVSFAICMMVRKKKLIWVSTLVWRTAQEESAQEYTVYTHKCILFIVFLFECHTYILNNIKREYFCVFLIFINFTFIPNSFFFLLDTHTHSFARSLVWPALLSLFTDLHHLCKVHTIFYAYFFVILFLCGE